MIIKEIITEGEDREVRIQIELTTEAGEYSVTFGEGEPEDMYLFRDLSDAYSISSLLVRAYNAGLNGEEFSGVEKETSED